MKLLFIITKGLEDSVSAIRVIQVAALTSEQGNHVEVFLLGEAVHWARGISSLGGEGLRKSLVGRRHRSCLCLYHRRVHTTA